MRRGLYCGMRRRFCREMTKYYNGKSKKTYTYPTINQTKTNANNSNTELSGGWIVFFIILGSLALLLFMMHPIMFICLIVFIMFCAVANT